MHARFVTALLGGALAISGLAGCHSSSQPAVSTTTPAARPTGHYDTAGYYRYQPARPARPSYDYRPTYYPRPPY